LSALIEYIKEQQIPEFDELMKALNTVQGRLNFTIREHLGFGKTDNQTRI
jgi:hypothetical protein